MGMRFRKSIKIAPGVKVNLGKKSVGVSVGGKYGGVSYNTRTGARARASAPGTGISYSTKIGGSTRSSAPKRSGSNYQSASNYEANASSTTPSDLKAEVAKLQSNLKVVKIAYPVMIVLFVIFGFSAGSICFVIAGLLALYAINFRKKALARIPLLTQQADELDLVENELNIIEEAERELASTKSAALFFLNYARIIEASVTIAEKAPAISQYSNPDDCKLAISETLNSEIGRIMKTDFEKTYKHLFELKTQKGIDSAISKFKAPYEPNLELLNEGQNRIYQSYIKTLESVKLADA